MSPAWGTCTLSPLGNAGISEESHPLRRDKARSGVRGPPTRGTLGFLGLRADDIGAADSSRSGSPLLLPLPGVRAKGIADCTASAWSLEGVRRGRGGAPEAEGATGNCCCSC